MSRLDKHKAAHKAAVSRKKVQSNPLEEIMRPVPQGEHVCEYGDEIWCLVCKRPKPPAPSPVGASRPVEVLLADYVGLCQKHGHTSPEVRTFLEEHGDDAELLSLCRTSNWLWEKIKSLKRSGQSPAMRDERMRRKGRFPDHTRIVCVYLGEKWAAEAEVADVGEREGPMLMATGPGIHGAIENLWDQYCRWRDEQKEAVK